MDFYIAALEATKGWEWGQWEGGTQQKHNLYFLI